jgi:hypothetical protein
MKLFFIILFCSTSITALSQTKLIAFKSHSGNMENFTVALNSELFDSEGSNFGIPSYVNSFRLDSVIYISPSLSIVVQTVFTRRFGKPEDSARIEKTQRKKVHNETLFANKHLLDSIRNILITKSGYGKAAANLVLVGFDNTISKQKKNKGVSGTIKNAKEQNILPVMESSTPPAPPAIFDALMAKLIAAILLAALLGSWFCWRLFQPKLQTA